MRYIKFILPILIIFLTIGFAATNVTLSISGDAYIASDLDDFDVYISSIQLAGVEDLSLLKSSTEFEFVVNEIDDEVMVSYEVTNASSKFDADIDVVCEYDFDISGSLNYYENSFDVDTLLEARTYRNGYIYVTINSPVPKDGYLVSCKVEATPIERTEYGEGEVPEQSDPAYAIGTEITINKEKFNVISDNGNTVTMLAQYNLIYSSSNYIQSNTANTVAFSSSTGWEYKPGPKEVDIQTWSSNPKTFVNGYISYLKKHSGDIYLTGDLITVTQLIKLGCTVSSDYTSTGTHSCIDSPNKDWLLNGQPWWTKSAHAEYASSLWIVYSGGSLGRDTYASKQSIRPVITIDKDAVLGKYVFFTVENVNYQAEVGMTLEDWVNSEYNLDGYYIEDGTIYSADGTMSGTTNVKTVIYKGLICDLL